MMSRYTSGQINVFSVILKTLSNNEANAYEINVNGQTGSRTTDSRRDDQQT